MLLSYNGHFHFASCLNCLNNAQYMHIYATLNVETRMKGDLTPFNVVISTDMLGIH